MSETYSYPSEEHYDEPTNAYEMIAEELRLYPDAESFRRNITGLSRMYGKTPLLESFMKYSYLMNAMKVRSGAEGSSLRIDSEFNVGTIFATHVLLKPRSKPYRQAMLYIDPLEGLGDIENNKAHLTEIMDSLNEWENGFCRDLFNTLEQDYKDLILAAAERFFADQQDCAGRVEAFKSGYMFAAYRIEDYDQYVEPYGSYLP